LRLAFLEDTCNETRVFIFALTRFTERLTESESVLRNHCCSSVLLSCPSLTAPALNAPMWVWGPHRKSFRVPSYGERHPFGVGFSCTSRPGRRVNDRIRMLLAGVVLPC